MDELGDVPKSIVTHGPRAFAGDVSLISGRPAVVSGYARGATDVYEVSPDALKQLLNHDPDLGDLILQAFIARRQLLRDSATEFTGLRVLGSHSSQDTFRVRDFLTRNAQPFTWLDLDTDPAAKDLLRLFGLTEADTPVVSCGRHLVLKNPTPRDLAEAIGLRRIPAPKVYDLVVVGAGPAGLAAAVYGASEGLSTVVLETMAPGGQAGRSMRIENYLGFAGGITGEKLIEQAVMQASKFGACLPVGARVSGLSFDGPLNVVQLDGDETVKAKCLLIATGAEYRVLGVEGCEKYEGRGVYYAATPNRGPDVLPGRKSSWSAGATRPGRRPSSWPVPATPARSTSSSAATTCTRTCPSYLVSRVEGTDNIEVTDEHRGPPARRRRIAGAGRAGEPEDRRGHAAGVPGRVQLHRGDPADRLAAASRSSGTTSSSSRPAPAWCRRRTGRRSDRRSFWRRAGRACSRRGTSGPARSSALLQPWVRDRWPSSSSTNT